MRKFNIGDLVKVRVNIDNATIFLTTGKVVTLSTGESEFPIGLIVKDSYKGLTKKFCSFVDEAGNDTDIELEPPDYISYLSVHKGEIRHLMGNKIKHYGIVDFCKEYYKSYV